MGITSKALVLNEEETKRLRIQEVELPDLKEGEALVKMKAAALNHRDQWIREGQYGNIKYPSILGSDGCGVLEHVKDEQYVDWVGKEVIINPGLNWGNDEKAQSKNFEVLGMPTNGTFSEYFKIPANQLYLKPDHLSVEQAAALPLAGLTAYRALMVQGGANAGQNILITGVGGGVAQLVLEYARALNAKIFITSGSNEKIEKAKELGAIEGANYHTENWHKNLKSEWGQMDLIIDSAGGDQWNALIDLLKPGCKLVFYGATLGHPSALHLHKIFWKQLTIQGSTMGSHQDFANMLAFVESKKIIPTVDSIRSFPEIVSAFDELKKGQQFGKLVVKF